MTWTVTLKQLRAAGACISGYNKLIHSLQGKPFTEADWLREFHIRFAHKEEIHLGFILDSNGLDDALWAARCVVGHDRDLRLFAVWCARQVAHHMTDRRSLAAIDVAEKFANGAATVQELAGAEQDARSAANDITAKVAIQADAPWAAPWAAAWAAADAAWLDAGIAARTACNDAADATGIAARTACNDDEEARKEARQAQEAMFRQMLAGTAPWQTPTEEAK